MEETANVAAAKETDRRVCGGGVLFGHSLLFTFTKMLRVGKCLFSAKARDPDTGDNNGVCQPGGGCARL